MSDLDLLHHYRELKQFLDISDDSNSRAKLNSSRAARAREKLLRLSSAQFRELSTDVYDELRRRIDESRSEPDFLLPKLTFHPKRNQARQKLSLLPQSRFKDLVSDISFEIERRNLHTAAVAPELPGPRRLAQELTLAPAPRGHGHSRSQSTNEHPFFGSEKLASLAAAGNASVHSQNQGQNHQNQTTYAPRDQNSALLRSAAKDDGQFSTQSASPSATRSMSFGEKLEHPSNLGNSVSGNAGYSGAHEDAAKSSALRDELATPDLRNAVSEKAIGIQPTTVIPTKASMTWSSDEEDAEDSFKDNLKENRRSGFHEEPRQLGLSNAFAGHGSAYPAPQPPQSSQPEQISRSAPVAQKPSVSSEEHGDLISAYESLRKEHESLIGAHADAKRELEDLTSTHADAKVQLAESAVSHQSASRELGELNDSHLGLSLKNQELKDLIKQLQGDKADLISQQASATSEDEIVALKEELEEAKAAIAALRLENQNLKTTKSKSDTTGSTSREIQPQLSASGKSEVSENGKSPTGSVEINAELQKLHDKLSQVSSEPSPNLMSLKEARLQDEISQWQKKYESLKAGELYNLTRNPVNSMDLTKFRSPNGVLSYKTAVELFSSIDLFYASLDITSPDPDLFFERISSIAISANKVASQSKKQGLNDSGHAEAIRECANHALTATRYYIIYPTLMPKVIVERAVSEIAFAVCDSIAALKFTQGVDGEAQSVESTVSENSKGGNVVGDDISVKPLRIPQKTQPYSSRNQSEEQVSGVVTPKRSSRTSDDASQFSPIQSRAKGQSLPTPIGRNALNASKSVISDSKLPSNGKLSFRNFFGAKSEDSASDQSPGEIPERSAQRNTEFALDDKVVAMLKKSDEEVNQKVSSKLTTPNILDKVRKFEAGNTKKASGFDESIPTPRSLSVNTGQLAENDASATNVDELKSSPALSDGGPNRNKSIFQSLRERFTTDNATKSLKPSGDNMANNGESYEVDNDEADHSLNKIDTPSKSKVENRSPFTDTAGSFEPGNITQKADAAGASNAHVRKLTEPAKDVPETSSPAPSSNHVTGNLVKEAVPALSTAGLQSLKPDSNTSTINSSNANRNPVLALKNDVSSTGTPFNPVDKDAQPFTETDDNTVASGTELKLTGEKSVPWSSDMAEKNTSTPVAKAVASSTDEILQASRDSAKKLGAGKDKLSATAEQIMTPKTETATTASNNTLGSRNMFNPVASNAMGLQFEKVTSAIGNKISAKNETGQVPENREVKPEASNAMGLQFKKVTSAINNQISSKNESGDQVLESREINPEAGNAMGLQFKKVTSAINKQISSQNERGNIASNDTNTLQNDETPMNEKAFAMASNAMGPKFEKITSAIGNKISATNESGDQAQEKKEINPKVVNDMDLQFKQATSAINNQMSSKNERGDNASSDEQTSLNEKAFSMASNVMGPKFEKVTSAIGNKISAKNESGDQVPESREVKPEASNAMDLQFKKVTSAINNQISSKNKSGDQVLESREINPEAGNAMGLQFKKVTSAINKQISSQNERGNIASNDTNTLQNDETPMNEKAFAMASNTVGLQFDKVTSAIGNKISAKNESGDQVPESREVKPDASNAMGLQFKKVTSAINNQISSKNESGDQVLESREINPEAGNAMGLQFKKVTSAINKQISSQNERGNIASNDTNTLQNDETPMNEKVLAMASNAMGPKFEKVTSTIGNKISAKNESDDKVEENKETNSEADNAMGLQFKKVTSAIGNKFSAKNESEDQVAEKKEKSAVSNPMGLQLEKVSSTIGKNLSSSKDRLNEVVNNVLTSKNKELSAETNHTPTASTASSPDSMRKEIVSLIVGGLPSRSSERKEAQAPDGASGSLIANKFLSSDGVQGIQKKAHIPDLKSKFQPNGSPTSRSVLAESNTKAVDPNSPNSQKLPYGLKMKSPSFKVRKVNYEDPKDEITPQASEEEEDSYDEEEDEIKQRQDYRKSMAAATFNFDLFDIDDPDNTVTQVLLYLEHQTVQVISTIQDLLSAIKKPDATRGELRENSSAISEVIKQMTEATNTSMNQTRNFELKEHGGWVVRSLEDCNHRMRALCKPSSEKEDLEFADRHFKQRLAGISFDIAKCTKELVKTVEEASLKEDIANLDARLNHPDDLT